MGVARCEQERADVVGVRLGDGDDVDDGEVVRDECLQLAVGGGPHARSCALENVPDRPTAARLRHVHEMGQRLVG